MSSCNLWRLNRKEFSDRLLILICFSYIRKSVSQVYKPTIGADFHSKKLEIMEGDDLKNVTL